MIKNCNKKLQGLEKCFVGSMQMVHLKKEFTNPCTSNGAAVTRLEKNMATLCYLPECTGSKAQTYKSHKKNTKEYTV